MTNIGEGRGKVMEFQHHSYEVTLRGHGILRYGHGKIMEFCCKNFVATLS